MTSNHWPARTFLDRVEPDTAARLLGLVPPRRVSMGDVLIGQGQNSGQVLLLCPVEAGESACVKVTSVLRNGTEVMLGIRVHGDIVGEMGMFRGSGASATVIACMPMAVRAYTHTTFRDFLARHRDAWEAVGAVMGDRLASSDRYRAEFVGYEVEARLARVLVELAGRHGRNIPEGMELGVRLSQTDLGKLIGARTDAVGNALRQFRREGILLPGYRRVIIVEMDKLRAVYENA